MDAPARHNKSFPIRGLPQGQSFGGRSTLIEILARILQHENPLSTVMLRDGKTREPVLGVATGPNPDKLTDTRLAPGKGIAGWVAEHKAKTKLIRVLDAMRTK